MMEILEIVFTFAILFVTFFFILQSYKYFKTMWRFKNRKKDGSEDEDFKRFD